MNNYVYALASFGPDLYVGGSFGTAGGNNAFAIARWNGSSWSALGSPASTSGLNNIVRTLTLSSTDLYAGGDFWGTFGGTGINRIAKWNGSGWSPLGSGNDNTVSALALSGIDLYVGGSFTHAGGNASPNIAKARIGSLARSVVATNSAASIQFFGVTGYLYDVQRATNLNPPVTWSILTSSPLSPADDGFFTFTDTNAPPGTAYYRAVEH